MSYISSNANRFYAAPENAYGQIPTITGANRFPAVKLTTRQELVRAERKDKSGTRTFPGTPPGTRRQTTFELTTYMSSWSNPPDEPGYGPLFRATLGGAPVLFAGGTASAGSSASQIAFNATHGLMAGQAKKPCFGMTCGPRCHLLLGLRRRGASIAGTILMIHLVGPTLTSLGAFWLGVLRILRVTFSSA